MLYRRKLLGLLLLLTILVLIISESLFTFVAEIVSSGKITTRSQEAAGHNRVLPKALDGKAFVNKSSRCETSCTTGTPCVYKDEVDFRIIVITYNRASSLRKCLDHVLTLKTLGDTVHVEVWIDRSDKGVVDEGCLREALEFQKKWNKLHEGGACVHTQDRKANIAGQWVDTWRPKENSSELGLILEDDIDISAWAYKWLKAVHQRFGHRQDIMGYALQMENNRFQTGKEKTIVGPKTDSVFLYRNFATWGYSPHPRVWPLYQDWLHRVRRENRIQPYLKGFRSTRWRKQFEKEGTQESQWEIWHTYFAYLNSYYCVFSNLKAYTGKSDVLLCQNREEKGLHYKKTVVKESDHLLTEWQDDYTVFPNETVIYDYDGKIIHHI